MLFETLHDITNKKIKSFLGGVGAYLDWGGGGSTHLQSIYCLVPYTDLDNRGYLGVLFKTFRTSSQQQRVMTRTAHRPRWNKVWQYCNQVFFVMEIGEMFHLRILLSDIQLLSWTKLAITRVLSLLYKDSDGDSFGLCMELLRWNIGGILCIFYRYDIHKYPILITYVSEYSNHVSPFLSTSLRIDVRVCYPSPLKLNCKAIKTVLSLIKSARFTCIRT